MNHDTETLAQCDVCGALPAPHCIGGEDYYCVECTPYDTFNDTAMTTHTIDPSDPKHDDEAYSWFTLIIGEEADPRFTAGHYKDEGAVAK